jgi:hypothetical protein
VAFQKILFSSAEIFDRKNTISAGYPNNFSKAGQVKTRTLQTQRIAKKTTNPCFLRITNTPKGVNRFNIQQNGIKNDGQRAAKH